MTEQDMIIQDLRRENENLRAELEWKQKEIELARRHARQWISVEDRLPEDDSDVLAYSRNGEECRIYPANYAKGVWFDCIFITPATDTTTHWMPLPEAPKEVEK